MNKGWIRASMILLATAGLALGGCADKTKKAYAEAATAQALLEAGDLPGARAAISRALALRGDQADLLVLDGRIRYQMQDYGGSFDSYNLALSIDPNQPEALQAVSQIGAQTGHERESIAATEKILSLDPNNAPALLVTGVRQLTKRDFAGAIATGERMLKADPKSEAGLVLKARGMFQAGQQPEALALLRQGIEQLGQTQMIVTALLESAREQGDADLMIEQYRALSGLVPKNADLAIDEANVQYKRGLKDEARARGWALLTDNGNNADAVQRLADVWTEYDKSPLTPDEIAKLASEGAAPARLTLARFYLTNGDAKTANTLVGNLPGDDAAGVRARIAYATGGDTAAAEDVLSRDDKNCDALAVRAGSAIQNGKPADGVIASQVIAAECPDRDGYALLAQAYRAKGEEGGVRRAFVDWLNAQPLSAVPVARYAEWLIATGDGGQAIAIVRRLTQRAPAKISSWQMLGAICVRASQPACVQEAKTGEAAARKNFALDLPPGERRPNPLLGNSWR